MAHRPRFVLALLAPALAIAAPRAQESVHTVVPGRDFDSVRLLTPGLTDVWQLEVEREEMLHCIVDSQTFDPVLRLVDADGELLGENDGAGTRSELWLRMPRAGKVEFRVSPYQGSGGGNYSYHLHRFRTEPLAPAGSAEHEFGSTQWWHYRVALAEGDLLVPTVTGRGRLTAVLDADRRAVPEVLGAFRAPRDGDYFVRVEGDARQSCRTTLQLARRRGLEPGERVDEELPAFGLDVWRMRVDAGVAYRIDAAIPAATLDVEIADPAPTREGPCFRTPGHLDKGGQLRHYLFARRDGDIELRLRNREGRAAAYGVVVVTETASITPGQPIAATLGRGEGALYRLDADSGQWLRLSLSSTSFDGRLDLWGPDGVVLVALDDAGPLDRNPRHELLVDRAGTYRLLAWSHGGAGSGGYELRVDALPVPELAAGGRLETRVVAGGTSYAHLQLTAGQAIWLSVRSADFDAGLTVLDPTGRQHLSAEAGGLGGDVLAACRAEVAGRYTLLVHSRSGAGVAEVRAVIP
ncbi:MAG: hypothetical protein IPM29_29700 [Planctomycetes bacterium]|nr:hypothetical protein [Planctomycetota bacterium]